MTQNQAFCVCEPTIAVASYKASVLLQPQTSQRFSPNPQFPYTIVPPVGFEQSDS